MTVKVKINNNGSIRIEGDIELVDGEGNKFDLNGRTAISLCRCARTSNPPFCDGEHARCGYQSQVIACTLPPPKK